MGRPFRIAWQETPEALFRRYRAEPDPQLRPRWQALWLLRTGRGLRETAQIVGVHYRTLQQWVAWYRAAGLTALQAHRKAGPGRVARLRPEQEQELLAQATTGSFRTAQDVQQWLGTRFGVTYTRKGVYSLLSRLGWRPKVPRPQSTRAAPEVQEAWKKGGLRRR